jgi:hypothetical protein
VAAYLVAAVSASAQAATVWMDDVTVLPGDTVFQVPIRIDAGSAPIVAYDLEITNSNPGVAAIIDILPGNFISISSPFGKAVSPDRARLGDFDNDFTDNAGTGVLAFLVMDPISAGLTSLDFVLDRVGFEVLADTGGNDERDLGYAFAGATINVVPLPAAAPLFLGAMSLVGLMARRRRR